MRFLMKTDMSRRDDALDNGRSNTYLQLQQSQAIRSNIHGMSQLLNTGLSPDTLDICIRLIEAGVHPQVVAEVVSQIRKEVAALEKEAE